MTLFPATTFLQINGALIRRGVDWLRRINSGAIKAVVGRKFSLRKLNVV